jgi:hypothetical protein
MQDSYQAIYDAVRSRISNGDLGEAVREVAASALDMSCVHAQLSNAISNVECEMIRPSVLWRPRLSIDGDKWCALYGENLQDGVAGFGESAERAMRDFDREWLSKLK